MKYRPTIYQARRTTSNQRTKSPRCACRAQTYHGPISALRTERGRVRRRAGREGIGENHNADAIHPAEIEDQRAEEADDQVVGHQVDAEP